MANSVSQDDEKLDKVSILERMEGSQELLAEVIQLFLQEAPELIAVMRQALLRGDLRELAQSAHSIKGAASNFLARATTSASSQLEKDAKSGDVESARVSLGVLEAVVERLLSQLTELCEGLAK